MNPYELGRMTSSPTTSSTASSSTVRIGDGHSAYDADPGSDSASIITDRQQPAQMRNADMDFFQLREQQSGDLSAVAGPTPGSSMTSLAPQTYLDMRDDEDDRDSALGSDVYSDRGSLTESVLAYRTINGRRYHAERGGAQHWAANDDAHIESAELHYYVINDYQECVFHAPLQFRSGGRILDIGTGNGLWAIDVADLFPNCEVIGTDISPIQPTWVPPNLRFDIEDCTQPWSYADASVDFVHIRLLYGSVPDWEHVYNEAYRVLKPGGWLEHADCEPYITSDDPSVAFPPTLAEWNRIFREGGRRSGQTFDVIKKDIQMTQFARLGMQEVEKRDWRMPIGGWPEDPRMRFIGNGILIALDQDIEGYISLMARLVAGSTREDVEDLCARLRREISRKDLKLNYTHRTVWGRKPD